MRKWLVRLWALVGLDRSDLFIAVALALIAVGLWPVLGASALVVPGLVLLWLALPPRTPFIRR